VVVEKTQQQRQQYYYLQVNYAILARKAKSIVKLNAAFTVNSIGYRLQKTHQEMR